MENYLNTVIKKKCFYCEDSSRCSKEDCPLQTVKEGESTSEVSQRKAIRGYCLFCMNNQEKEIYKCVNGECPFFRYRS